MAKKKGGTKGKKGKKGEKKTGPSEKELLTAKQSALEQELLHQTELCTSLEKETEEARLLYEREVEEKDALAKHLQSVLRMEVEKSEKLQKELEIKIQTHEPKKQEIQDRLNGLKEKFETMKMNLAEDKLTISGKLSVLKEVEMQWEGLERKLNAAKGRVMTQLTSYEEELRNIEIRYSLLRDQLKKEYVTNTEEVCAAFRVGACEILTYIIKRGLEKSMEITEQLNRTSDAGLEEQERNFEFRNQEMLLNFEFESDEASDRYLFEKNEESKRKIEELQESCIKQEEDASSLESVFDRYKATTTRVQEKNYEFLEISDEYQELKDKSIEQKRYLRMTRALVFRRHEMNSKLISAIRKVEHVFQSQIAESALDKYSEPVTRNDLMRQFVTLLDINSILGKSKKQFNQSERRSSSPSWFRDLKGKKNMDVSVQTTDILAKYHKTGEFKSHFFERKKENKKH